MQFDLFIPVRYSKNLQQMNTITKKKKNNKNFFKNVNTIKFLFIRMILQTLQVPINIACALVEKERKHLLSTRYNFSTR